MAERNGMLRERAEMAIHATKPGLAYQRAREREREQSESGRIRALSAGGAQEENWRGRGERRQRDNEQEQKIQRGGWFGQVRSSQTRTGHRAGQEGGRAPSDPDRAERRRATQRVWAPGDSDAGTLLLASSDFCLI
nr:unnamed protein product [Digitaria exilis]